jgi:hypothetical protein
MKGFVHFADISEKVLFKTLLDHLNVCYEETEREMKGEIKGWKFIVNKEKNLFFSPGGDKKGSVINMWSEIHGVSLREAALAISRLFIAPDHTLERAIPELELLYTPELAKMKLTKEICSQYEIGMVKQRSIMSGKLAFRLYDEAKKPLGYIGKEVKKDGWFYPKGFRRNFLYNGFRVSGDYCIVVPDALACVRICQLGFPYTVATLGLSPTQEQMEILKRYRRVLLIHPSPGNTLLRLAGQSFVKTSQAEITAETGAWQIKSLF